MVYDSKDSSGGMGNYNPPPSAPHGMKLVLIAAGVATALVLYFFLR